MNTAPIKREQKNFAFEVKEFDDETGTVKGYLSTYNNIDEGGDRVLPGAFKRTLLSKYQYKQKHNKKYLLPLLWQHDTNNPIGGYTEAKEDSTGLYVEFQVDMDVQRGREAYSGLKKGYIFQQSIGYEPIKNEYVKEPDGKMVRDLIEVRLWEGSIVTFPMNELAVITSVKDIEGTISSYQPTVMLRGKGDGKSMDTRQKKTLMEHYNEENAADLLEDWQDVYVCSLTCALLDALTIGDSTEQDISEALDAFKELVMSKFVSQALECNLSQYITDSSYSFNPSSSTLQNGSDDGHGYYGMSRSTPMQRKAGRSVSAANQHIIDQHVASVKALAKKAKAGMQTHVDSMHEAVDEMSGDSKALGTLARKAGRSLSADNADALHDFADKAMAIVQEHTKSLNKAANGLASSMKPPANDPEKDGDDQNDQDQQIEKSIQDALKELKALAI